VSLNLVSFRTKIAPHFSFLCCCWNISTIFLLRVILEISFVYFFFLFHRVTLEIFEISQLHSGHFVFVICTSISLRSHYMRVLFLRNSCDFRCGLRIIYLFKSLHFFRCHIVFFLLWRHGLHSVLRWVLCILVTLSILQRCSQLYYLKIVVFNFSNFIIS